MEAKIDVEGKYSPQDLSWEHTSCTQREVQMQKYAKMGTD